MKKEYAMFGAGCFWGVQHVFSKLDGVVSTRAGYTGGKTKNPTYEEVCSGNSGHAESVEVAFNPERTSYKELVDVFFRSHDPTTPNMQFPDYGMQYRSVIFYFNLKQKNIAEKAKKEWEKRIKRKIVTEIKKAKEFYSAEEYHQDYTRKHGEGSCHIPRNPYLP